MKPDEIIQVSQGWLNQKHPESYYIELKIREKKRIVSHWESKVLVAQAHKKRNEEKIKVLEQKLQDAKILEILKK